MRYPQTFIDDLKRQADIVRVIQDYVQLKKKGANWMACCPFHKEKTPSFSVSPTKEIFYCFGCHKGGSVFNFEFVRNGRPMSGRFYFLKANDNTVYVLRFMGYRDRLRSIRNQTDSIGRTFTLGANKS